MTNQNDSNTPASDPKEQPPLEAPVSPAAPQEGQVGTERNASTNRQQNVTQELAREFRWVEFAQIGSNVILASVGIFALCIYKGQLNVMRGQLGEIIKQYPELQKSAAAAKSASETAQNTLLEIQGEQRPWILVKSGTIATLEPKRKISLDIVLANFGHSPAFQEKAIATIFATNDPKLDVPPLPPANEVNSAILAPTMESHLKVETFKTMEELSGELGVFKSPEFRYYFYGRGTYNEDLTPNKVHRFEFCMYLTYGVTGVTPCTGKRYKNITD